MKTKLIVITTLLALTLAFTACTLKSTSQPATKAPAMETSIVTASDSSPSDSTNPMAEYKKITAMQAAEMMTDTAIILDVRTLDEYNTEHIQNAILIESTEITEKATMLLSDKDQVILVYCRSGNRSETAAKELIDMGYTNVYDFGGIGDWTGNKVSK